MARKGPEASFQDALVEYARTVGWRVAHFRRATVRQGRVATPVAYDGAGFPDLVMVRNGVLIFAELKQKGRRALRPDQRTWADALSDVEDNCDVVSYVVWNPTDWGEIERVLR